MKVLVICQADWCNVGYATAKALKTAGVDALSIKTSKHNFGYAEESEVVSKETIVKQITLADIVFICNSNYFCLELCKQLGKKKVYVYHTGTTYRRKPAEHNKDFNPYIKRAFTDQTEFIGMGMKNEHYIFSAIDTDHLKCDIKTPGQKLKVAHFPSNPIVKGTAIIRQNLEILKKEYEFLNMLEFVIDEKNVPHEEQIKRMSECDVYIELFAPTHEGNPYGCFGVTAIEAAALGKIVVTNHTTPHVYTKFYGRSTPFITPQTEEEFYQCLKNLMLCNREALYRQKLITRQWAEEYHSYKATGERLKKLIEA